MMPRFTNWIVHNMRKGPLSNRDRNSITKASSGEPMNGDAREGTPGSGELSDVCRSYRHPPGHPRLGNETIPEPVT